MRNWQKKLFQNKNAPIEHQTRFQSGMTFEQKFQSISENVLSNMVPSQSIKGCTMHPKISKKCRKCLQIQKINEIQIQKAEEIALETEFPEVLKWNNNLFRNHFNQKLHKNIEDSAAYKNKLKVLHTVKELSQSLTNQQISIDAYIPGSTDTPTEFICYLYRLGELRPTKEQITIMLRSNNVNIRCLILLYLRVFLQPMQVYACLSSIFKDHRLLSTITIGQYAMRLLDENELNHGGFRLPRLPIKIQRQIEKRIKLLKEKRQKQFDRERSRSRQKKQRILQKKNEQQKSSQSPDSQSEQQQQKADRPQKQQIKVQQGYKLSLKDRIRILQQKNKAQMKRKALLQTYKAQNINKLQSDEQQYNENDSVERYNIG